MIDNLLYFNNFLNFYSSLFNPFYNFDLRNFSDHLNDSLYYLWNLNNSLDNSFHWDDLFNNIGDNSWNLERNIYDSLYFSNFLYLYYFLDNLFNSNNLRYFNNSVYNFLNNLLYLDYFWHNSEDFKNIIYINNSHNLLINHSNNSLINFKSCSSLPF